MMGVVALAEMMLRRKQVDVQMDTIKSKNIVELRIVAGGHAPAIMIVRQEQVVAFIHIQLINAIPINQMDLIHQTQ